MLDLALGPDRFGALGGGNRVQVCALADEHVDVARRVGHEIGEQ